MKHLHCTEVDCFDALALGLQGTEGMTLRILSDDSTWIELQPGGHTPDHRHNDKELIVVMSGNAVIKLGNQSKDIRPNAFREVSEEDHQIINTGNEVFAFMCFRNQR